MSALVAEQMPGICPFPVGLQGSLAEVRTALIRFA
jgi:hypothetical protein